MTYEEAEAYINDTPRFTKKNTLDNTRMVLERMGHPERRMKLIHVAGSNGKGSVCAYLSSILRVAGKHVGLFTSPHLERINERFCIDEEYVSDEEFLEAFEAV
ncbi:MAG: bifunctional folylpolyglutamate synthase/dihydrofolate synthase, partial [Lachnospiraceae bacterium]|nr:bifunctional folylpolyglutamate synthase/dihydrofolate synthase [Lachnospiraceae bacterium]